MIILSDNDINSVPITEFIKPIHDFVISSYREITTSPPRQMTEFPSGRIVFTVGGIGELAGFRAYETFNTSDRTNEQQVVVAWDTRTCVLKGAAFGMRLGAIRTGVLGGIAVTALAPVSASSCALIGTGVQAETQLLSIVAQRQMKEVRVFSRRREDRDAFVKRMRDRVHATIISFDSAEDAVSNADIAVLATNSEVPVIDPAALKAVKHITTVGPKFRDSHELPLEVVEGRFIISDSPQQIKDQGQRHMLSDMQCSDIVHLGQLLSGELQIQNQPSLYLSAGLAGTEVVALDAALSFKRRVLPLHHGGDGLARLI